MDNPATEAFLIGGNTIGEILIFLLLIAFSSVFITSFWLVFKKAGRAGWKSIIPIYNFYVILKIVGRPGWWLILSIIPFFNVIFIVIVMNDLAESFGKGAGYTVGLFLLGFIFFPILGFGKARYHGPAAATTPSRPSG